MHVGDCQVPLFVARCQRPLRIDMGNINLRVEHIRLPDFLEDTRECDPDSFHNRQRNIYFLLLSGWLPSGH